MMNIGDELEVDVTAIAHGGHCVARNEGRVIFVRHTIPGERVKVRITELSKSFARADCIEVVSASADRIKPTCTYAHPGGCGGCDFQHIAPHRQRELKSLIIKEQFARLAKLDISVEVEEVLPTLGWRSRMEFNINKKSRVAMFQARSNELIEIESCKIADPRISIEKINEMKLVPGEKFEVAVSGTGEVHYGDADRITYEISGRSFAVSFGSFWQSHIAAPNLLTNIVTEFADYKESDHVLDLYAGVGILTSPALSLIGPGGRLTLIEESELAVSDSRWNYADQLNVHIKQGRVERQISEIHSCDVVVLDPPRAGAGAKVIGEIVRLAPRKIIYVACDPAALARDVAELHANSYRMEKLRAFDLFPMTQHIECVARFIKV